MAITPKDIREQQFGLKFRGFDVSEVDDFLEYVAEELEKILAAKQSLEEQLKQKELDTEKLKAKEEELRKTLLTAQRLREDLGSEAKKKAEDIIQEAEAKAQKIIQEHQEKITHLQEQKNKFQNELREVIKAHIALLGDELTPEKKKANKGDNKRSVSAQKMDVFELDLDEEYDGKLEIKSTKDKHRLI